MLGFGGLGWLELNTGRSVLFTLCICIGDMFDGRASSTCLQDGMWSIVQGLEIDADSAEKIKATGEELVEEKALALECLTSV